MSKPYTPRQGSAPAIVIDHLRAAGGTLTSAQFAELTGCDASSAFAILQSAMRHGVIVRAPGSTPGKTLFALADGAEALLDAAGAPNPETKGKRKAKGGSAGARRKTARSQRAPAQDADEHTPAVEQEGSEPAADAQADPSGPVACLWDDGDIVLHGLKVNDDGATATITPAHARRLHAFLDRLYGTPVARPVQSGGGLVYAAHMPTPPLMLAEGRAR